VALEEGRKYLCEGRGQLAIPTALQALKMLSDMYGHTDVHLTPAFLILAEAAIGEYKLVTMNKVHILSCRTRFSH